MSFSHEILDKWKKRGQDNKSKNTYQMIVGLLDKYCKDIIVVDNESVFLQGSYVNHTNIKNDSDIDVVVLAKDVFSNNAVEVLPTDKLEEFNKMYNDSDKTLDMFKEQLYNRLNGKQLGDKTIILQRGCKTIKFNQNNEFSDFVPVDIVPAFEYRKYNKNSQADRKLQIEGIKIFDTCTNDTIINYPKQHKKNGESKNAENRTSGNYKETVRIFKQIKKYLIENNVIKEDLMPSYCLECMLYNVPDGKFRLDLTKRIDNIIDWLLLNINVKFLEQNEMYYLFVHSLDISNAKIFLEKCKWLSNTWSKS